MLRACQRTLRRHVPTKRGFYALNRAFDEQRRSASEGSTQSANETVPIAEAEVLLFKGIKSIGYSDADANVMKEAMM